jgi:uncharacterized DUF497 family protein
MIDFAKIVGFDWDTANSRKNQEKHGVTMAEAEQLFFNIPLLMLEDSAHSEAEARIHALGKTDRGRRLHIYPTRNGNLDSSHIRQGHAQKGATDL